MREILNRLLGRQEENNPYAPFGSIPEIVVAHTIRRLQERNGSASLKAISDQLGDKVETGDVPRALLLLKERQFIAENDRRYTLTHNGDVALNRVIEAQRGGIQGYLDGGHAGLTL